MLINSTCWAKMLFGGCTWCAHTHTNLGYLPLFPDNLRQVTSTICSYVQIYKTFLRQWSRHVLHNLLFCGFLKFLFYRIGLFFLNRCWNFLNASLSMLFFFSHQDFIANITNCYPRNTLSENCTSCSIPSSQFLITLPHQQQSRNCHTKKQGFVFQCHSIVCFQMASCLCKPA